MANIIGLTTPLRFRGAIPAAPTTGSAAAQAAYDASQDATQIAARDAAQKEERKVQIRQRISEIDALLAKASQNTVIAEAARVGNLQPYMQQLAQQQGAAQASRSAATGVENGLYNAEKILGVLKTGTKEERENARAQIAAAMIQAKEQGAKSGINAEALPSYQRLASALKEYDPQGQDGAQRTYLEWETAIQRKIDAKTLKDADLAELRAESERLGNNSEEGRKLLKLAKDSKNATVEARARTDKKKADAEAEALAWPEMTPFEAENKWRQLAEARHPITEYYELRTGTAKPTRRTK